MIFVPLVVRFDWSLKVADLLEASTANCSWEFGLNRWTVSGSRDGINMVFTVPHCSNQ